MILQCVCVLYCDIAMHLYLCVYIYIKYLDIALYVCIQINYCDIPLHLYVYIK